MKYSASFQKVSSPTPSSVAWAVVVLPEDSSKAALQSDGMTVSLLQI